MPVKNNVKKLIKKTDLLEDLNDVRILYTLKFQLYHVLHNF